VAVSQAGALVGRVVAASAASRVVEDLAGQVVAGWAVAG